MAIRPCGACGAPTQPPSTGFFDDRFAQVMEHDGPAHESLVRDPKDEIVVPIPIGNFPNGYSLGGPAYEPVSGFEHLSNTAEFPQHFVQPAAVQPEALSAPAREPKNLDEASEMDQAHARQDTDSCVAKLIEPATSILTSATTTNEEDTLPTRRTKRPRRATPEPRPRKTQRSILKLPPYPSTVSPEKETFHIGDLDAVKEFFKRRLQELTLNPLRSIATEWIKLAEPSRKRDWGPYSRVAPESDPNGEYPSWWPRHVKHMEPGHLKIKDLVAISVQLLLLHLYRDSNNNPRIGWTLELKKAANYVVEAITIEKFAAGGKEYNTAMKKRAVKDIIPDLLKVAQAYEDHVAPYKLWKKGRDDASIPLGEQHTWTPCPRPRRLKRMASPWSESRRKRFRREHSPTTSIGDSDSHSERDVKFAPSRETTPGYASTTCDSPMTMSASGSFTFPTCPASQPMLQSNDFQSFGARARTQSVTYVPVFHGMPHLAPFDAITGPMSTMSAPPQPLPAADLSMPHWPPADRSQRYNPEFPSYFI